MALAIDMSGTESDRCCYGLDRNAGQQLVDKALPAFTAFQCIGAGDAVSEFEHRNDGDGNSIVANFPRHGFQQLAGILTLAFGGDGCRRVEH
jgi:hypothetical protein